MLGGFFLNKSLASYQDTRKFNVIEGTVKYEGSGDVYVAAYIDGVQTSGDFPDKLAYKFDKAECNNGAEIEFDSIRWKATVTDLTIAKTKYNLYFKTRAEYGNKINEIIAVLAKEDTINLAYDGTVEDSNIRYIGANPNNYVTFNGEQWRIMGTFKDIDDGTGKLEWRTKIIRTASLGNKSWDMDSANCGYGINEWSTSDIKNELNGSYLTELTQVAKDMISDAVWNLGTNGSADYALATSSIFYEYEGSSNTGKICSNGTSCDDTVIRTIKWLGKIGLMYPSDYGYATGGSTRSTCLNVPLSDWNNSADCFNNDWLFNSTNQWLMTPAAYSLYASPVFNISSNGSITDSYAVNTHTIRPTLYLASNVMITGGSGTSIDPYQLSV